MQKLFFALLVFAIGAVIFFANRKDESKEIRSLRLTGCNLLAPEDYLSFTGLMNKNLHGIQPGILRDKLKKHPYIKDVLILFSEPEVLEIQIEEKIFKARLLTLNHEYFVSNNLEIIKHLPHTVAADLPLITGVQCDEVDTLSVPETNKVKNAVAVINATEIDSIYYGKNLSEISLSDNGIMFITLANIRPMIMFTANNIAKEVIYVLSILKEKSSYSRILTNAVYLDARFQDKIFIGYGYQSGS